MNSSSIPYLQRKHKISYEEAKKRHEEIQQVEQAQKKPRVYHFQKYWAEEWEKCLKKAQEREAAS